MEEQLILLSLLSLACLSASQDCSPALLENTDFPGSDVANVFAADAVHCQNLCTQHPGCSFFTFVQPKSANSHFTCYLKATESGQPTVQRPRNGGVSGFSLKPCQPHNPSPCMLNVFPNVDFPGSDFRSLFTYDYKECQRVCTDEPGCQFFTFTTELDSTRDQRFKCYLKFSWNVPTPLVINKKEGVISGFSDVLQMELSNKPDCQSNPFINLDSPGNDILEMPAVCFEHCQALCTAHPLCTYFSYMSTTFACYLKRNTNTFVLTAKASTSTGLPTRSCRASNDWLKVKYHGAAFPRIDLSCKMASNVDDCATLCNEDPNCQFYTYHTDDGPPLTRRRCYLKRAITLPAPPKVAIKSNVISGFSLKSCV
ncbi:coagulation factor XI-like [Synchiropus splendidus]|uniref:coagulation factor XI-like n=1 Tax=Synchiropus splendidus TaxID=270530 RepID=UPI00237E48B8|nr:coagulation factor XI-like [Synchiropus splendidus]XP_053718882.1 coagulation factor XI-like [Synchiropus splendidus]